MTLSDVDQVFRRWLGAEYDIHALHAVIAAAAAERLDGDPLWLLVISGPGNAKTETVQALKGAGATVISTIASEGALLSGTAKREHSKDASGGLLRKLGARGLLVIKDFTSILSMNRDTRAGVLAALREVYDGFWSRSVGTDGGRSIEWRGRLVVIGACTTVWDQAHAVIASMGDRFVVVRVDSSVGRLAAGRQAISNTGVEDVMRRELAAAVGGLLRNIRAPGVTLTRDEREHVLAAANIVTLTRTGVEHDYRGDVVDAHAPEAPTRFAKQLSQVIRGAVAVGLSRPDALGLAVRCARDSMPPLRLAILEDVSKFAGATTNDVRKRLQKPRNTVDRQLQALHMLGLLTCDEEARVEVDRRPGTIWHYRLAEGIDPDVLNVPEMSGHAHFNTRSETEGRFADFRGTFRTCGADCRGCAHCDGPDRDVRVM